MKNIRIFYLKICHCLVVKFSVYLNRRVFVMYCEKKNRRNITQFGLYNCTPELERITTITDRQVLNLLCSPTNTLPLRIKPFTNCEQR